MAEPLWDLVEESLDEAVFLWKRWEADLDSPVRSLEEVRSWTEDRLQGALDGVRVAGDRLPTLVRPLLEDDEPLRLTVAAHLLAAGSAPAAREHLAAAIRQANGPRLWSMIRGIEAAALDASFAPVTAALSGTSLEHLAALCRLKAFRRSSPGREVAAVFESGEPSLQVEALRLLHHAKDDSAGKYVEAGLRSEDPGVRRAALECGVRQKQASVWEAIRKLVYERDPGGGPFLTLLAVFGSPDDRDGLIAALREPALQHAGLFALGYLGTPEAVEICLRAMREPRLARAAGEAYCAITGTDLQRDGLMAPEPPESDSAPAFATDPLDADLVPKARDLWPLPDVARVREHWQVASTGYVPGARYLYGRPVDLPVLISAIESGPMLRRPHLIGELTIRSGGRYDVEPRAFAQVQRGMMSAGRGTVH
jgi:uncharacterized protein (TIGR02270 family)